VATPRKHWFKVADSLTQEPFSNDELATLIRLMGELNQRWARDGLSADQACSILLRPGDLMSCTGTGSLARARRVANALAVHVSLTVDAQGTNTLIKWPKWSIFQGLDTREQGKPGENPGQKTPPPQDARRKTQDAPARQKKERSQATAASAAPVSENPSGKGSKPDQFDGTYRDRIVQWAKTKGYPKDVLDVGMERFREWSPLKQVNRTQSQWVGAFMRIVREGVEGGSIVAKGDEKPKGLAYGDAAPMLRERKRVHDEENARGAEKLRLVDAQTPEAVGALIDEALKRGKR